MKIRYLKILLVLTVSILTACSKCDPATEVCDGSSFWYTPTSSGNGQCSSQVIGLENKIIDTMATAKQGLSAARSDSERATILYPPIPICDQFKALVPSSSYCVRPTQGNYLYASDIYKNCADWNQLYQLYSRGF